MFNTVGEFVSIATAEMRADTLARLDAFREIIAASGSAEPDARENRRKKDTGSAPPKPKRSRLAHAV
jgi:hypothetical protein